MNKRQGKVINNMGSSDNSDLFNLEVEKRFQHEEHARPPSRLGVTTEDGKGTKKEI